MIFALVGFLVMVVRQENCQIPKIFIRDFGI